MFTNLVGLVTGGASGLGKALVQKLVSEKCNVCFCDLPTSEGQKLAEDLGKNVMFSETDVRDIKQVEDVMERINVKFGKLHFIVNCAALVECAEKVYNFNRGKPHGTETFESVINTNLLGTFHVISRGVPIIGRNVPDEDGLRGVVINTSGLEAYDAQTGQVAIAAASGGIAAMTLPLSRDLSDRGIRVACICPGFMNTPPLQRLSEKFINHISQSCLAPKRLGEPHEFVQTVIFILQNRYINGEIIRLDAGLRSCLH